MSRINRLFLLLPLLLLVSGCQRLIATQGAKPAVPVPPAAVQISAPGVDAAEPITASAPDGSFYVAWVNHDAKQADVMIANFGSNGEMRGAPVRVNRAAGVATAWRGDQPSLAVAGDGSVYVVWTARVDAGGKHGTDLYMSVSNDRAQSFASEVKINDDKIPGAHGMHSLAIAKDGRVYVGWLDERNIQKPKPSTKAKATTWKATAIFLSRTRTTVAALFQQIERSRTKRVRVVRRRLQLRMMARCTPVGVRFCREAFATLR